MLLKIVTLFTSTLNELHALSFYKPLIAHEGAFPAISTLGGGGQQLKSNNNHLLNLVCLSPMTFKGGGEGGGGGKLPLEAF